VALRGAVRKSKDSLPKNGKRLGISVDEELEQWVEAGCPALATLPAPSAHLLEIATVLQRFQWTPVSAQLALGCCRLRLGTKVDLLCRDASGQYIIVELKTGFGNYVDVENQGYHAHPFDDIKASCRSKHFLQLLLTSWLFVHAQHEHKDAKLAGAYVLRLFHDDHNQLQSEVCALPGWLVADRARLDKCLKVIERTKNVTVKQRKRLLVNGARRGRSRFAKQEFMAAHPRAKWRLHKKKSAS
jgi:hypothetical protein